MSLDIILGCPQSGPAIIGRKKISIKLRLMRKKQKMAIKTQIPNK